MNTVFSEDGFVPIEVASNIMSYLPNEDLNKMALMNSHCEYVSRITFIQYRISKWFFKNLTSLNHKDHYRKRNNKSVNGDNDADEDEDGDGDEFEENGDNVGELNVMNMSAQSYFSFFVLRVMVPIKKHIIGTSEQRHRFLKCPPLHYLIHLGLESEVLFKHLIQRRDIDVNEVDKCHQNALHALCACKHLDKIHTAMELLDALLESGIDYTARAAKNDLAYDQTLTCLDFAALTKKYGVMRRLLTLPKSRTLVATSCDPMGPLWTGIDKEFDDDATLEEITSCMELIVENGYSWKNHPHVFLPNHSLLMKKAVQLGLFNQLNTRSWLVHKYIHHIFQLGDLDLYEFVERFVSSSTIYGLNNKLFNPQYNPFLLHEAAASGHLPLVIHVAKLNKDTLNSIQFNLEGSDNHGYSPLHLAIINGKNLECVKFLKQFGADLSLLTSDGRSCVMLASERGCLDILDYLVSHCGCSLEPQYISTSDPYMVNKSPLLSSVASMDKDIVQYIIEHRLKHETKTIDQILREHNNKQQNIFHLACRRKVHDPRQIFQLIRYLFSFACAQDMCASGDQDYATPRVTAKIFMPPQILGLIDWYLTLNPVERALATSDNGKAIALEHLGESTLQFITRAGDLHSFNYFLDKYPAWFNKHKFHLCNTAAKGGNRRILEVLLSQLSSEDIRKFDWNQVLKNTSMALVSEDEVIANIQFVALFVLQNCPYSNLFARKSGEECPQWMKDMPDNSIYVYLQSIVNYSHVLHMYIHINDIESASQLLRKDKTGLSKRCQKGLFTAIQIACQRGSIEMIKLLIQYGAVIDYSCLRCAASSGDLTIIKFVHNELAENTHRIVITASDANKQNVLHYVLYGGIASVEKMLDALQFFMARGAHECIFMPDSGGCTPLAISAMIDPAISQYLRTISDLKKVSTAL